MPQLHRLNMIYFLKVTLFNKLICYMRALSLYDHLWSSALTQLNGDWLRFERKKKLLRLVGAFIESVELH